MQHDTITGDEAAMPKTKFKQGDWLIRRWAKQYGGETDFVRFEGPIDSKNFKHSKFYRIGIRKVENAQDWYDPDTNETINYVDSRMLVQFRKATKSEIQKYAAMIMNAPMPS